MRTARSAQIGPAVALRSPFEESWHISCFRLPAGWILAPADRRDIVSQDEWGAWRLAGMSDLAVDRNLMVRHTAFIRV